MLHGIRPISSSGVMATKGYIRGRVSTLPLLLFKFWFLFVRELTLFAVSRCSRLRAESFGVEPFVCTFVVPGAGELQFPVGGKSGPCSLKIGFRSFSIAVKLFLGLRSVPVAFAEGWMYVDGPVEQAVALTRFFERFESVVFPYPLFPHLYRGRPRFSFRRLGLRILLYLYSPVALVKALLSWR